MWHMEKNINVNEALLRIIVAENMIYKSAISLSHSCQILIKSIDR
jgi:hypothetical protein